MYGSTMPRPRTTRSMRRARITTGGCLGALMLAIAGVIVSLIGAALIYVFFPPPPLTILVMGLDARTGEGYATRADSIMLVGLQPRGLKTGMLSIPRDLFLDAPGYGLQRVNTINVLGELEESGRGAALMIDAVDLSFGVRPHRYARLNFEAFVAMIDAVGGVDIDVQRAIYDPEYPTPNGGIELVQFETGWQHMDGATALKYARTRHSDDDYFRSGRQQQVVDAFLGKLWNPFNWPRVMIALGQNVDTNISIFDMLIYAPAALMGQREQQVIDRDYIVPVQGGASPDYAKLAPWIDAYFK